MIATVCLLGAVIAQPALAQAAPAAASIAPAPPARFAPPEKKPPPLSPPPPPSSPSGPVATDPAAPLLESETSDIATLPPAKAHRLYVGTRQGGYSIIDGDSAKVVGTVNGSNFAVLAVAPDNSAFYVAETLWSHGNRGERRDMVSVYDGTSLTLRKEIALPGRLIAGGRVPYFGLSASGARGYVYNMEPAPSVITVDLRKQAVLSTVEIPGCGLVYPFRDEGFAALCADGALASVTVDARGRGTITHTPVFFDVERDPVFEESLVDRRTGAAFFITYSGMVHPAMLGSTTRLDTPWSIQRAAGLGVATTAPQHKTWRPGGRHPFAYHPASGRMFVLMHEGVHWTQKDAGSEVWVIDTRTQTLIRRFQLPTSGYVVAISQDATPQLYVVSEEGWLWVIDPETGRIERNLDEVGRPSLVAVTGF